MILICLLLLENEPGLVHFIQIQISCPIIVSHSYKVFLSNMFSVVVPKIVQEALIIPEWNDAIREEIRVIGKNGR